MIALLKFLLIVYVLYWLAKQAIKAFLPRLIFKKHQEFQRKQGEMNVDNPTTPAINKKFKGGEYIDYEEVK